MGVPLHARNSAVLGVISDLLIDTARNRISFLALRPNSASSALLAVPWADVKWRRTARGTYVARLMNGAQSQGPYQDAAFTPGAVDILTELVGRPVRAGTGVIIGTARDLLVAMPRGSVVDLLVKKGTGAGGTVGAAASVPWCYVADLQAERSIVLTLDPSQIGKAPPCAAPARP